MSIDNVILETVIRASVQAGVSILEVYNAPSYVSQLKEDNSPLTEADKAASLIINKHLEPTGIPIINEEIKNKPYNERKSWAKCWIVDPLDGTKEFIKRNGEFTVNIALFSINEPNIGVIYVPVSRELYYTNIKGTAAYKTKLGENHKLDFDSLFQSEDEIKPSMTNTNSIRVVGSRSHMNSDTELFIEELKHKYEGVEIVSKGSSLKFCLVAEGKADVYPRFAPTMEWDTAAGQAICEAVGLQVISKETDKPLKYNKENLLNPYFIVRQ
ncbi:3'(2'),5'-bisphosphate nucleotidase CysQ [Eudoraea chungangensis]|uniref:3'(2'),5'-bisphosphate nucleotidase CysQ n=1 Tax=Eudoraea chungangensis TaxID=1481905 RepID=UPI0023EC4F77|nr:3'(2'),5'-bisphosphate nucleotidase CysQ [Eudoraea chungangensis]